MQVPTAAGFGLALVGNADDDPARQLRMHVFVAAEVVVAVVFVLEGCDGGLIAGAELICASAEAGREGSCIGVVCIRKGNPLDRGNGAEAVLKGKASLSRDEGDGPPAAAVDGVAGELVEVGSTADALAAGAVGSWLNTDDAPPADMPAKGDPEGGRKVENTSCCAVEGLIVVGRVAPEGNEAGLVSATEAASIGVKLA